MCEQVPTDVRNRPWWRYGRMALGDILLIELPFVVLALNSTIPYQAHWLSDGQGGTTILRYWDGRTEVTSHTQRPIWVSVLSTVVVLFAVAWLALWAVLGWRWFRRWRDRGYPWRFRFSLRSLLGSVVLAGVCLTAVTVIEPESPALVRLLVTGVLLWMFGCLLVLRHWLRSRSADRCEGAPRS